MKNLMCAFLLFAASLAYAGYDEGLAAYNKGDYPTAFKEFTQAAEQGNASAQYNLGQMYREGQGVPQNYGQAAAWYTQAAQQGDARAQYNLGFMYDNGLGVPQDYAQAVAWYTKAAQQDVAAAQVNLGNMYSKGQGVPQDYAQAVAWYTKAAQQDVAAAQYNLGLMYGNGQGVSQSFKIAYILFNWVASKGNDNVAKNRDIVSKKMTPTAIADAQRITTRLYNAKDFAAELQKVLNGQK